MGRPAQALISRDRIAVAALELLDEHGPAGLGMRPLAQRLGVQAPSLYHHVSGLDEVIELVHDLVDSRIDLSALADADWRRGMERFARSYRQAFLDHPNVLPVVVRRPLHARLALRVYEGQAGALERLGLPRPEAMRFMALLDYIVLGSAMDVFILGFADLDQVGEDLPNLRAALAVTDVETIDEEAFSVALRTYLDALAERLARA